MKKYGTEHFSIELIEETLVPEQREQYWINFYNSYKEGYNATLGGDGKSYINQEQIVQLWKDGLFCQQIAEATGHNASWISTILQQNGVNQEEIHKRGIDAHKRAVIQLNKSDRQVIAQFNSIKEAAQEIINQGLSNCKISTASTHIGEVCKGKRKTFAGFAWEYLSP